MRAGPVTLRLPELAKGRSRLTLQATDLAGNASAKARKALTLGRALK